jgi:CheY-like chemotaxis protein
VENIEMARQLVGLSGGSLEIVPGEGRYYPLTVRLILPAREQAAVLVIDDNVDTLQLFQRYLAGSRYAFIGTHDPDQALTLAEKLTPRIIVLDVMLPGVDGWELLGRLREHPKIYGVPIIVCTILPQEQLALALGAAAFIRKPVSQTALLSALDHQFDRLSRESG